MDGESGSGNVVLTIISLLAAAAAAANGFGVTVGLPPFWIDVLLSAVLLYACFDWARSLRVRRRPSSIVGPATHTISMRALFALIVLTILLFWTARPPLMHALERRWSLCGQFLTRCDETACISFSDARKRPVTGDCHVAGDASGFHQIAAPNWWTYKPVFVSATCRSDERPARRLPQQVFDPTCRAKVDLR